MESGDSGEILELVEGPMQVKLLEMGLIPGEKIHLKYKAPMGDPYCVFVAGYQLALGKDIAESILLKERSR